MWSSHLRSEPEEVNVASGVVAMGRSGAAGRIRRGGRQDAHATLCANFHELELPPSPGGCKTLDLDQSRDASGKAFQLRPAELVIRSVLAFHMGR